MIALGELIGCSVAGHPNITRWLGNMKKLKHWPSVQEAFYKYVVEPNKGKDFWAQCGSTVWHEGDDINMACPCANAEGNSTAAVAVGDLDYDGVPEIIVVALRTSSMSFARPKSMIFTWRSEVHIVFAVLMSRCTTLRP